MSQTVLRWAVTWLVVSVILLRCISYWLELLDPLNSDILLIRCRRLPMVNSVSVEDGDGSDLFPIQTTTLLRQVFGCGRLHYSLNLWQYRLINKAPCKRTQHCWMWHVASVCTPCCMLLRVVGSCCAKFETGQTFSYVQTDATTPNIAGTTMSGVVASFCAQLKSVVRGRSDRLRN